MNVSVIHVLDENGKTILRKSMPGTMEILMQELGKIKHPFRICYEASTGYGTLYEKISGLRAAKEVIVANPGKIRLIFKSKKKTDRIDAKKLATLLMLEEVPQVYVPHVNVRNWRTMINHRNSISDDRKRIKNRIRSFLRHRGIQAPKGLWSKKGMQWLKDLTFDLPMDTIQRNSLTMNLEMMTEMIKLVEKELKKIADRHPGVKLLMGIPGVGIRTAEAVMAYIDDPKRFTRIQSIGDYFGVVPKLDASAGKYRYGHITKDGPAVVRKMITEAAWQGIRRSSELRERFNRYLRKDKQRKRIAIVAVAHFLLRAMLRMLKNNQKWNPALV
jgi:transposase